MKKNQIWKIYGTDYKAMTREILEKTDMKSLIPGKDACIGIKPNLVCPSPAEFGGTTHTELVAGIIEYLQENGYTNLLITEGSWVGDRTAEAFEYCGYNALSKKYNVPLIDCQKDSYHEVDAAGLPIKICDVVDRLDFIINIPIVKGHCQTKVTCALKNMKGLIPNTEKRHFHTQGLHKPIAHLSTVLKGDYILVDHICGDLDFEEGGNPVVRNCIMAALDPVLVDSYACYLMHYDVSEVPYIPLAEKLGVGTTDLGQAEIINLNEGTMDEELPQERRILEVSYAVDEVDSCSACYGNLIPALYRLKDEGLLEGFEEKIAIGQGHQGQTGKLGIGRCCSGYDYCVMGCPPDEDKIYEELKKYILEVARS